MSNDKEENISEMKALLREELNACLSWNVMPVISHH
jgi:hypothetical protein